MEEIIEPEKFEKAKNEAEILYKGIKDVYCPYLEEKVIFNAKGLEHLKFKSRNKARSKRDQYIRLRLLSLVPDILKKSHTLQGLYETKNFELERTSSRWERILRNATYYEFISVIKKTRVRVIVKQVENGPKYFWSIIPFWKQLETLGRRKLHNGKPEED